MLRIITVILLAAMVVGPKPEVADLSLPDQNGAEDSLSDHRGDVVVVFVVTARRLRNVRGWEKSLRDRYDALSIVRIADVPEGSPASYEDVAAKFRKRVPDEVRVLIDLHRAWATELELDTGRPNVLVFDRDGALTASVRGLADPPLLQEVFGAIDALEAEP